MSKLENGLLFGSFNPLHVGHIQVLQFALEHFEVMHVFTRYTEGVDMVDWETKLSWLNRVNEECCDGRLRFYKFVLAMKDKQYAKLDFTGTFLECERRCGVHLDGLVCGEDMRYMADALSADLPDRTFIVHPRGEHSSSRVREDLDRWKDDLPKYVYDGLKAMGY